MASTPQATPNPRPQSATATAITDLLGGAGLDPTQPGGPTTPGTPIPLTETLWAAYRETQTVSSLTLPVASTVTNSQTASAGDPTLDATIPVDPNNLAVSSDGKRLYALDPNDGTITVIDANTKGVIGQPIPVGDKVFAMAVSRDGSRAYVLRSDSNTVTVVDTVHQKTIGSPIQLSAQPEAVAVSPDGGRLYVAEDGVVQTVDTQSRKVSAPIVLTTRRSLTDVVVVSNDGSRVYVGNRSADGGQVFILDPSGKKIGTVAVPTSPLGLALSQDGSKLYITGDGGTQVVVVDTNKRAVIGPDLEVIGDANEPTLNPSGSRLYVIDGELHQVTTFDTKTGKQIGAQIKLPTGDAPQALVVSPDGTKLYVAGRNTVYVYTVDKGPNGSPAQPQPDVGKFIQQVLKGLVDIEISLRDDTDALLGKQLGVSPDIVKSIHGLYDLFGVILDLGEGSIDLGTGQHVVTGSLHLASGVAGGVALGLPIFPPQLIPIKAAFGSAAIALNLLEAGVELGYPNL